MLLKFNMFTSFITIQITMTKIHATKKKKTISRFSFWKGKIRRILLIVAFSEPLEKAWKKKF